MPDTEPQHQRPSSANGLKRRRSEQSEQESKRQRKSPGKSSPTVKSEEESDDKHVTPLDSPTTTKPEDARDARRKSGVADEKQRSKRLFGALLGNLNRPSDRTSKRRQEIEERRKAELQRQDDERLEDKQRRLDQLAEQRRKAQVKVDEQNMRTRHSNMLNAANFLQTTTEPKLYYRPWDLRADEEDRIDDQIKEAQDQIDVELGVREVPKAEDVHLEATVNRPDEEARPRSTVTLPETTETASTTEAGASDGVIPQVDGMAETERSPEVPLSDATSTNGDHKAAEEKEMPKQDSVEKRQEVEDDGDHVVEGDEDTVIY